MKRDLAAVDAELKAVAVIHESIPDPLALLCEG